MHSPSEPLKRVCGSGLDLLACAGLACVLLACNGEEPPTGTGAAGATIETPKCAADTPVFTATPSSGLTLPSASKALSARVTAAKPAEPMRYRNDWTLQFFDAAGAPVNDIEVNDVCAWMYVHNHGGPATKVTPTPDKSIFQITELNLFMAGPWSVEIVASSPSHPGAGGEYTKCEEATTGQNRRVGTDKIVIPVCVKDE